MGQPISPSSLRNKLCRWPLQQKGRVFGKNEEVLLLLAEQYLGPEIADALRNVFELYIKSEYVWNS
jgi:hypothetical protein